MRELPSDRALAETRVYQQPSRNVSYTYITKAQFLLEQDRSHSNDAADSEYLVGTDTLAHKSQRLSVF